LDAGIYPEDRLEILVVDGRSGEGARESEFPQRVVRFKASSGTRKLK
jgi:hypothetical protein